MTRYNHKKMWDSFFQCEIKAKRAITRSRPAICFNFSRILYSCYWQFTRYLLFDEALIDDDYDRVHRAQKTFDRKNRPWRYLCVLHRARLILARSFGSKLRMASRSATCDTAAPGKSGATVERSSVKQWHAFRDLYESAHADGRPRQLLTRESVIFDTVTRKRGEIAW